MSKLWGGAFEGKTDREVEDFTSSLAVDSRLWQADLVASQAHARMLGAVGVLTKDESAKIVEGLEKVREDIPAKLDPRAEDIHSELERLLKARIGDVAGKLHTGRSRNDQVATATRLHLMGELDAFRGEIGRLQSWLTKAAEQNLETLLPGFTHLQHAQPVSLAHHLLAYFWMLERDRERLADCRARCDSMPLGSAALAGTSFPLDRRMVAKELGFSKVTENSLDAVSDRDFVVETLSACALVMTHLSRVCEELIIWSTPEFGFVRMDDSVTTGSSIMPQKKNPDVAELIRGRVGRVNGALVGALTMLKGLPLSYNRDLQEDKALLFDGLDTTRASTRLALKLLEGARFDSKRMRAAIEGDFSNATDLADALARAGIPFRKAHELSGRAVRAALEKGVTLERLSRVDREEIDPALADLLPPSPEEVVAARTTEGGTSPDAVRAQLALARRALST